jgi:hypothetical protein
MTGIRQNESGDYSIEPNPASGLFRVKSGSGIGFPRSVRILSLTGESFAGSIAWEMVNEKVLLVYVQHQSPGLYFVEIITDTMKKTLKLVLQ